jgi:DNA-directed RNA polymerase II subunit RPB1
MNSHLPQSVATTVELKDIMAVPHQIVSPQSCSPVIGYIQDSLLGAVLFTKPDNIMTRKEVVQYLGYLNNSYEVDDREKWTGQEVVSLFLPPITYKRGDIIIEDGVFLQGILGKKDMGASAGGLIHVIWNDFGPEGCTRFINDFQCVLHRWLMTQGFSVGLSDTISDNETMKEVKQMIQTSKLEVQKKITALDKQSRTLVDDEIIQSAFEFEVMQILDKARNQAGELALKTVHDINRIRAMVMAGSKGKMLNIAQIMGIVGQQAVTTNKNKGRVSNAFRDRPYPHVAKFDLTPEARGFIDTSYLEGLDPKAFFAHMMSGREGLTY